MGQSMRDLTSKNQNQMFVDLQIRLESSDEMISPKLPPTTLTPYHRHALEDMPPEDVELPPESPTARTRDNRRRLALASDMPLADGGDSGGSKAHHGHGSKVQLMDPLQYVTYSGGLGE